MTVVIVVNKTKAAKMRIVRPLAIRHQKQHLADREGVFFIMQTNQKFRC